MTAPFTNQLLRLWNVFFCVSLLSVGSGAAQPFFEDVTAETIGPLPLIPGGIVFGTTTTTAIWTYF